MATLEGASINNTNSMAPLILPSDKPIVKKSKNHKLNDIVVISKKSRLVAHRVIYLSLNKKYLVTKGDNNYKSDGKIKQEKVLGKVEEIKRNKELINLSHIYFSQSSSYLKELAQINKAFHKKSINYLILKGLILNLFVKNAPPQRLYFDADLLIQKKDLQKTASLLQKLGFQKLQPELFKKTAKKPSQLTLVKKTEPFPVYIDLHIEPGVGFTKLTNLNSLLPQIKTFNKHLFSTTQKVKVESTSFLLLRNDELLVYLLLHFYHHNFNGIHRLELINELINKKKIDWKKVENMTRRFRLENFIYPGILMTMKYYNTKIPHTVLANIKRSRLRKLKLLPKSPRYGDGYQLPGKLG